EFLVLGGGLVAGNGIGDGGGDVEGGSSGGPVARALVAANRPPGKGGAAEAQLSCPFAREVERGVPPAERVGGRFRRGVGEHREDEALGVPEGVAVVAGAGQALRRDRALLGARARLQRVEEREPDRLLQLGVALELDVGTVPELVKVRPLVIEETLPAGVAGLSQGGDDLVANRRQRALARPAVGEELDHPQSLSGREL